MKISVLFGVAALLLTGCSQSVVNDTPTRAVIADSNLPPAKQFSNARPKMPRMANADIARDFIDLHFRLESGRRLETFTRFETPITVRVTGAPSANMNADLDRVIQRMRSEAGVDIRKVPSGDANVTIQAVTREDIRRTLPQAACFVVPNVSSLAEFRRERRKAKTNWALLERRTKLAIFIPNDASPQEVRDCLHEELAQAIGPLNDLYRLTESVFNDDNVHRVLTAYDMLILRATYAPEIQTGMSAEEVALQLPTILARLNPAGVGLAPVNRPSTSRKWIDDVQVALGPGSTPQARDKAAKDSLALAADAEWRDHRRAFSHFMVGRLAQASDPDLAKKHYDSAMYFLRRTPGTDLHAAYIVTQMAAIDIANGDAGKALARLDPAIPVAQRAENASLLATLMLLKAEALELVGRTDLARSVRLDSLGWARYGFGADWAVRAKMNEIAALNPLKRSEGQI